VQFSIEILREDLNLYSVHLEIRVVQVCAESENMLLSVCPKELLHYVFLIPGGG